LGYGVCHDCILTLKTRVFLTSVTKGIAEVTGGDGVVFMTFILGIPKKARQFFYYGGLVADKKIIFR
jgi:hypothetical protein